MTTNNEPVGFTSWKPGKPTEDTGKNCVIVESGAYDEKDCTKVYASICVIDTGT